MDDIPQNNKGRPRVWKFENMITPIILSRERKQRLLLIIHMKSKETISRKKEIILDRWSLFFYLRQLQSTDAGAERR